jgi:hypothetical protein
MNATRTAVFITFVVVPTLFVLAWYSTLVRPAHDCFDRIQSDLIVYADSATLLRAPVIRRSWLFADAPGLIELQVAYRQSTGAMTDRRFYCTIGRLGGVWGISEIEPPLVRYSQR